MKSTGHWEDASYFRPNGWAYSALVLATAALGVLYLVGLRALDTYDEATLPGGSRWALLAAELVLCAAVWLHVADHLLRHYEADQLGLTVYRLLLPPLRYSWKQVVEVRAYGYGDGLRLTIAGRGHLMVMLDCLRGGAQLAGYIQRMAGR